MKKPQGNVPLAALLFITLALTAAGGLYLWQTRINQPSTLPLAQQTTPPPAAIPPEQTAAASLTDETAGWKPYTDT